MISEFGPSIAAIKANQNPPRRHGGAEKIRIKIHHISLPLSAGRREYNGKPMSLRMSMWIGMISG
jgi:hypothetical protein